MSTVGAVAILVAVSGTPSDIMPAECAAHIARAIPKARLVTLKECGHFSYLERPDAVRREIRDFFQGTGAPARSQ